MNWVAFSGCLGKNLNVKSCYIFLAFAEEFFARFKESYIYLFLCFMPVLCTDHFLKFLQSSLPHKEKLYGKFLHDECKFLTWFFLFAIFKLHSSFVKVLIFIMNVDALFSFNSQKGISAAITLFIQIIMME